MARKPLTIIVLTLLVAGFLSLLTSGQGTPSPPAGKEPVATPVINGAAKGSTAMASAVELPPLPPELEGLEPEARLRTDDSGNLIPGPELRVLFDFFLANLDIEPLNTVLERIQRALGRRLESPAREQALALLEQYVGYRMSIEKLLDEQEAAVTQSGFQLEILKQRQQNLQAMRRNHFTPEEVDAFFSQDEQLDTYTLARIEVQQDASLSAAEKQRQLDQLEYQLAEPIRIARKKAVIHGNVYQRTQELKAGGASESDIFTHRADELGEEAATQLARLDREQDQWQSRLSDYRQKRAGIMDAGLSNNDRTTAIEHLREELFAGPELLRVRALDADLE